MNGPFINGLSCRQVRNGNSSYRRNGDSRYDKEQKSKLDADAADIDGWRDPTANEETPKSASSRLPTSQNRKRKVKIAVSQRKLSAVSLIKSLPFQVLVCLVIMAASLGGNIFPPNSPFLRILDLFCLGIFCQILLLSIMRFHREIKHQLLLNLHYACKINSLKTNSTS